MRWDASRGVRGSPTPGPRLSEVMEKQVAAELRKSLDQTVASLLTQLDANMRQIVREAVAERLGQPRDPS